MQRFSCFSSIEKRKIQEKMWFVFVFFPLFFLFRFLSVCKGRGKILDGRFFLVKKKGKEPFFFSGDKNQRVLTLLFSFDLFPWKLVVCFCFSPMWKEKEKRPLFLPFPNVNSFFPCFLDVWSCNNNSRNWSNDVEAQCESIATIFW